MRPRLSMLEVQRNRIREGKVQIFARKFEGKFEESEFSLEKSGQIISRHELLLKNSRRLKQWAAGKFVEFSSNFQGEQNFTIFRRKAPKFANFNELRSHYFCTIL